MLFTNKLKRINNYPCPVCDYLFTLTLSLVSGGVIYFIGGPWWVMIICAHFPVADFLMTTRK